MDKRVFLVRNVARNKFGGAEIYQLELAKKLRQAGFSPIVLTNSQELLRRLSLYGIEVIKPPYLKRQNWSGWRNIIFPLYVVRILRLRCWYGKIL